ncbi:MAG: flagellin FliC [Magnetococcus sp. WYHC-3]
MSMNLSINTNMAAISARRFLSHNTLQLGKTYEKLSTGLRVNGAKDDAAGLAISKRMEAAIRGKNQAYRNVNDAHAMLQLAEGTLGSIIDMMQRARELAVQAANDTYTTTDRETIQTELDQLFLEIQRTGASAQYNGRLVLAGIDAKNTNTNNGLYQFQVEDGVLGGDYVQVELGSVLLQEGSTGGAANATMALLLEFLSAAEGGNATTLVSDGTQGRTNAQDLISVIDEALSNTSSGLLGMRSNLGAWMNRFENTLDTLSSGSEHQSAAKSRIVDADIALETAELTRRSILQQASTAILAQANQQPQLALQLLG